MSYTLESTANNIIDSNISGFTKRVAVLMYGTISYAIGVGALLWIILAMGGLAPVGLGILQSESVISALLINVGLIVLFGVQHSVMARASFKRWLTRYIPVATERSTYLLSTAVVTAIALSVWQPLPGVVWEVESLTLQILLYTAYAIGWGYLFVATFVTNHFELMGLRQTYLYFRNIPYTNLPFARKLMYRYSRHPMMLGLLVGIWAIPVMSVSHFVMATLFSLYVAVGLFLEERDLVTRFGETYRQYRKEIAAIIPGMF